MLIKIIVIALLLLGSQAFSDAIPRPQTQLVILCYHHLNAKIKTPYNITDTLFKQELDTLSSQGFTFVSMQQIEDYYYANQPLPAKAAAITFDDGNLSVYQIAYPILTQRRIPWTLFVYPTAIRTGAPHIFMNWDQVKDLADHGVAIGSHAYWHPRLTDYAKEKDPEAWLTTQIVLSGKVIQQHTGKPVNTFAIPYGLWDRTVYTKLKNAGYRLVFNVNNSNNNRDNDPLNLNRQMISYGESNDYFTRRIQTQRLTTCQQTPLDLSIVNTSSTAISLTLPANPDLPHIEWTLREPRWGKIPLSPHHGELKTTVNLTQPGQYIPHLSGRDIHGAHYDDSWSFIYKK